MKITSEFFQTYIQNNKEWNPKGYKILWTNVALSDLYPE